MDIWKDDKNNYVWDLPHGPILVKNESNELAGWRKKLSCQMKIKFLENCELEPENFLTLSDFQDELFEVLS